MQCVYVICAIYVCIIQYAAYIYIYTHIYMQWKAHVYVMCPMSLCVVFDMYVSIHVCGVYVYDM